MLSYPIPKTDETLDILAGAKMFSTLDLRSEYWQVEVKPKHQEKTANCTPKDSLALWAVQYACHFPEVNKSSTYLLDYIGRPAWCTLIIIL